jgi:hypothetical protein
LYFYQAELKVLIANNIEECEKFKAQIVTSPEKFRKVRIIFERATLLTIYLNFENFIKKI